MHRDLQGGYVPNKGARSSALTYIATKGSSVFTVKGMRKRKGFHTAGAGTRAIALRPESQRQWGNGRLRQGGQLPGSCGSRQHQGSAQMDAPWRAIMP